ncbi:MAG: hypothetical protein O4965_15245 [Trichodesmium sp. St19_bin1]|nr:hypothetical protein [Trichodesmium sp. St19_bin1]
MNIEITEVGSGKCVLTNRGKCVLINCRGEIYITTFPTFTARTGGRYLWTCGVIECTALVNTTVNNGGKT